MHFHFEHAIATTLDRLERIVLDPRLVPRLAGRMPLIAEATLVERRELDDCRIERVERFRPSVRPPPFARNAKPEMMQWVQRTIWDRATHVGHWTIEPNIPAEWRRYFESAGSYALEPRGEKHTARVIQGDVVFRLPLIGALVERYAISQLRLQFDGEARLLDELARSDDPFAQTGVSGTYE